LKIVEYLDLLNKINKTNENKINDLEELIKSHLLLSINFDKNIEIKTLGEIALNIKTGKDINSTNRIKGNYPFYGANGIIDYVNEHLFDGIYLLTARTGSLGSLYLSNGKFNCSGDVYVIKFNDIINIRYIYYYLHTINFQDYRTGSTYPKLNSENLKLIKIPIPSLDKQEEIVNYLDLLNSNIGILKKEIELNKKLAEEFMKSALI